MELEKLMYAVFGCMGTIDWSHAEYRNCKIILSLNGSAWRCIVWTS